MSVAIEHWAKERLSISLPTSAGQAADEESASFGASLATGAPAASSGSVLGGGSVLRVEVVGGREARDLLVLALRYFVAQHCLAMLAGG